MTARFSISPSLDGVTHLNIHSNAATVLGRLLCDMAHTPFVHPVFGKFECLEGYRHWLRTGRRHSVLKELWGQAAKLRGGKFPEQLDMHYREYLIEGVHCKVSQTHGLHTQLLNNKLPITCYFVFNDSVRILKNAKIQVSEFELIRAGKPLLYHGW
jgi:phenylpropionate dioxygenase-like ring-hydroxylating dioxygenase large terminal subunit